MAINWYLMSEPPAYGADDGAEDLFAEAYNSVLGQDVKVYNYDMSECQELKCIVNSRHAATKLNSMVRYFLFPIGKVHAGMYVEYKNKYWIIENIVDDDTVADKAIGRICNVRCDWVNAEGKIISRYAYAANATQYNNGETLAKYFYYRSDQLMVTMPDDYETAMLETGNRIIFDKRCSFYEKSIGEDVDVDTSFEVLTYEVTRADNVEYNYGDQGVYAFMFTQDEQHEDDGFYRINGKGYWLTKKPNIIEDKLYHCEIVYDENVVYIGADESIFAAQFDNDTLENDFEWEIIADFADDLQVAYDKNFIYIACDNKKLRGQSFKLRLSCSGFESDEIEILIKSFF